MNALMDGRQALDDHPLQRANDSFEQDSRDVEPQARLRSQSKATTSLARAPDFFVKLRFN
jgi:hypothetical protein